MKKLRIIIITVALLWLAAYAISFVFSGNESIVGNGIAIVPIKGAILAESSNDLFSGSGMGSDVIINNLKKAEGNKNVKAVVLEINSPGGTVVASREVANYVAKLSENKPVVAWIREVGASGAYWIASSADLIIADELSITGSVGVISSYLEFSDFLERYGVKYERLVAGDLKDTGSPYKSLNDNERRLMESKLLKIQDVFVSEVAEKRGLGLAQINEIRNGFFYLGMEAFDLGLVDELGGRELAISRAKELAGIEKGNIVEYKPKQSFFDLIEKFSNKAFLNIGKGIGLSFSNNGFEILAI